MQLNNGLLRPTPVWTALADTKKIQNPEPSRTHELAWASFDVTPRCPKTQIQSLQKRKLVSFLNVFASRPFSASTKLNSTGTWIPAPMDTQWNHTPKRPE